jgi:hypothetical protein
VSYNELARGTIAESLVRVKLVAVGDPGRQLTHHGLGVGSGTDADVVAFDRADEGFSHSVALRTFNGRRSRFKTGITCSPERSAHLAQARYPI